MKTFSSFDDFANFLAQRVIEQQFNAKVLDEIGQMIQKRAREKLGHFQPAVGGFKAWASPLAERTQRERKEQGFTPNDPLLRSGAMRDDIDYEVDVVVGRVVIGSTLDKAVWNELGTSSAPPRPFLGPAAYESRHEIAALVTAAFLEDIAAISGFVGTKGSLTRSWRGASRFGV